jgi:hypothetical protein
MTADGGFVNSMLPIAKSCQAIVTENNLPSGGFLATVG